MNSGYFWRQFSNKIVWTFFSRIHIALMNCEVNICIWLQNQITFRCAPFTFSISWKGKTENNEQFLIFLSIFISLCALTCWIHNLHVIKSFKCITGNWDLIRYSMEKLLLLISYVFLLHYSPFNKCGWWILVLVTGFNLVVFGVFFSHAIIIYIRTMKWNEHHSKNLNNVLLWYTFFVDQYLEVELKLYWVIIFCVGNSIQNWSSVRNWNSSKFNSEISKGSAVYCQRQSSTLSRNM